MIERFKCGFASYFNIFKIMSFNKLLKKEKKRKENTDNLLADFPGEWSLGYFS